MVFHFLFGRNEREAKKNENGKQKKPLKHVINDEKGFAFGKRSTGNTPKQNE